MGIIHSGEKIWSKSDDRFGHQRASKFEIHPNTQVAAADESADQSWSDQGGCHFFGHTHSPIEYDGWGCVIAKVDPSKSAVCGPNQLISLGHYIFIQKVNLTPKFVRCIVSCCLQETGIFAGNSWPVFYKVLMTNWFSSQKYGTLKKSADLDNKQLI